MITPETCAEGRRLHTILTDGFHEILFDGGGDILAHVRNQRGMMEVLCAADRAPGFRSALVSGDPLRLHGFFRKRLGYRADRRPYLIWCLVLISWSPQENQAEAA